MNSNTFKLFNNGQSMESTMLKQVSIGYLEWIIIVNKYSKFYKRLIKTLKKHFSGFITGEYFGWLVLNYSVTEMEMNGS